MRRDQIAVQPFSVRREMAAGGFRWTAIVRSTTPGGGTFEAATVAGDVIVALENGPGERIRAWVGRIP